jgi:hypothetical protein
MMMDPTIAAFATANPIAVTICFVAACATIAFFFYLYFKAL